MRKTRKRSKRIDAKTETLMLQVWARLYRLPKATRLAVLGKLLEARVLPLPKP
jgi:hypothetical protein